MVCEREEIGASECSINVTKAGTHYMMEVEEYEERGYEQEIAIVIVEEGSCFSYPFSQPLYQHLGPGESSCVTMSTSLAKNENPIFQFMTSMNTIE